MVLVWAIPIILVVLLILYLARVRRGNSGKSALDILEARYAHSEIDWDGYLKRRTDLAG